MTPNKIKVIVISLSLVIGMILASIVNPFSWNDAGNRTVVEQAGGHQFVEFKPGLPGNNMNGVTNFMEVIGSKSALDLALSLKPNTKTLLADK